MNVKEAVAAAKKYVSELFSDEHVSNLALEEVNFDDGQAIWSITIGFSRPWSSLQEPSFSERLAVAAGAPRPLERAYKVVTINDDGRILSLKNREFGQAAE